MPKCKVARTISSRVRKMFSKCRGAKASDQFVNSEKNPWAICYDGEEETFVFKPSNAMEKYPNLTVVKYLPGNEINRFGSADTSEVDETYRKKILCIRCGLWLNGLCYKHPLVFVREKIPKKLLRYQVIDTLPPFFRLGKSTIPQAGLGVFTMMSLPAGLSFGPYAGRHSNNGMEVCSRYSWQVGNLDGLPSWVDAESLTFTNWLRYVNCPRSLIEQNMIGMLFQGQIYYYTYRPIEAGSELMVWYGQDYGMSLRIPNADKANGPVAPANYDQHDENGLWIGKPVVKYEKEENEEDEEEQSGSELQDAAITSCHSE